MAKSIDDILRKMEQERISRMEQERIQQQRIFEERERQRQENLRISRLYERASTNSPSSSSAAGGGRATIPLSLPTIEIISFNPIEYAPVIASITINVSSDGNSEVTERGIVYSADPNPEITTASPSNVYQIIAPSAGIGEFTLEDIDVYDLFGGTAYLRAYAINSVGTAYSEEVSWEPQLCLAKGTEISLSNGLKKLIEDITYDDGILVWNFDDGKFDSALPLWIKREEKSKKFNLLKFNDGTELKTISQHRIFNKELGKFTYTMTDETPIGTTSFNKNGDEIILISKEVIIEEIEYYNVITKYHMNMFANGVLTSCRYNNIYPINNMKFVKDNRQLRQKEEFSNISNEYINGLRLSEQSFTLKEINAYVNRLLKSEVIFENA